MSCSNCFNGCVEITSDKCIKYTGVDVPILGIKNGDSLSYIEQALIEFLTSTLDGSGIKLDIPEEDLCDIVNSYLPTCKDLSLLDLSIALIKTSCSLQEQITVVNNSISILNADYTISCLTGVTAAADTHAIVQAVINKLCSINSDISALALDISTNYVPISEINSYIAAYLSSTSVTTLVNSKMVPWTIVEYYGSITAFDITGKGTGVWDKIYLCNGLNGTPDKRGRVAVGATTGMGGGAFAAAVDPTNTNNPAYSLLSVGGANVVTLGISQIPSHTHTASVVVNDPTHTHAISPVYTAGGVTSNHLSFASNIAETTVTLTSAAATGISVAVTNTSMGGGMPHSNVQPVLACYYIIYIP